MSDETFEYQRTPIPEAALVDAAGSAIALTRLVRQRAVLVVFPGRSNDQWSATLRAIADWPRPMPLIDLVLVAARPLRYRANASPTGGWNTWKSRWSRSCAKTMQVTTNS